MSEQVRLADGREPTAILASLDSHSVKTTESAGSRGFDGGKKIKGRKRHIIVHTMGLLIGVLKPKTLWRTRRVRHSVFGFKFSFAYRFSTSDDELLFEKFFLVIFTSILGSILQSGW